MEEAAGETEGMQSVARSESREVRARSRREGEERREASCLDVGL